MISLIDHETCPSCGRKPSLQSLAETYVEDVPKLTIRALTSYGRTSWLCEHRKAFVLWAKYNGYGSSDIADYLGRDKSTINHILREATKQQEMED